jgi:hypothetical protein
MLLRISRCYHTVRASRPALESFCFPPLYVDVWKRIRALSCALYIGSHLSTIQLYLRQWELLIAEQAFRKCTCYFAEESMENNEYSAQVDMCRRQCQVTSDNYHVTLRHCEGFTAPRRWWYPNISASRFYSYNILEELSRKCAVSFTRIYVLVEPSKTS